MITSKKIAFGLVLSFAFATAAFAVPGNSHGVGMGHGDANVSSVTGATPPGNPTAKGLNGKRPYGWSQGKKTGWKKTRTKGLHCNGHHCVGKSKVKKSHHVKTHHNM